MKMSNFLFCMVMEECNPPQCQEEVQDEDDDENNNEEWDDSCLQTVVEIPD